MTCTLKNDHSCLPITALHVVDETVVLSGQGPCLRVTDGQSGHVYAATRVFDGQAVHGIATLKSTVAADLRDLYPIPRPANSYAFKAWSDFDHQASDICGWRIVCWGGSSLSFLTLLKDARHDHLYSLNIISRQISADDWVLHACFVPYDDESKPLAYLVNAHNALVSVRFGESKVHRVSCGVSSILYSAHLEWLSADQILIAGGTVFGEVIVWSYIPSQPSGLNRLHYILRGHLGSVFGVFISQEMHLSTSDASGSKRLLASCSDDRTIRIWDISDCLEEASPATGESVSKALTAYMTGLGRSSTKAPELLDGPCIAVAWGHASRIWGVYFLSFEAFQGGHVIHLASRGEDATCQVWKLHLPVRESSPQSQAASLINVATLGHHSGKNMWSLAFSMQASTCRFYSGGADGNVLHYVADLRPGHPSIFLTLKAELTFEALHRDLSTMYSHPNDATEPKRKTGVVPAMKSYSFVDHNRFLATSDHGFLAAGSIGGSQQPLTWAVVEKFEELRSSSVLASSLKAGLAFIAGDSGHISSFCHHSQPVLGLSALPRRPARLFVLDSGQRMALLATYLRPDIAQLFPICLEGEIGAPSRVRLHEPKDLLLPATFVVTSACMISNRDVLTIGSRSGALAVYELQQPQSPSLDSGCFRRVHDEDTVTSIRELPREQATDRSSFYILSCGRNGHYCVHAVRIDHNRSTLQTVHRLSLPFGPNIEGAYFDHCADLVLYGFRSKDFVVWNESRLQETMAVDCGGAHRNWSFAPGSAGGGTFVWTKASTFNLHSRSGPSHHLIQSGGHGREIKAVAVLHLSAEGDEQQLIATGAEDTTIRIFAACKRPGTESGQLNCLRVLKRHTTGVQHLQWSKCGNYLFSSGGNEELFAWRIRRIPGFGLGVMCEASVPKENIEADLRVTNFDVHSRTSRSERNESEDDQIFIISVAYSNSALKIFAYNPTETKLAFQLIYNGAYGTNCLTDATLVPSLSRFQLLSASTDGHAATWDPALEATNPSLAVTQGGAAQSLSVNSRHQIHQSSIKAMVTLRLTESELLLVTGGDDNALAFTRMFFAAGDCSQMPKWSTLVIPKAHAAAVNAIAVFEEPRNHGQKDDDFQRLLVVSSGNDQRLKVWRVQIATKVPGVAGIEVEKAANVSSAVADISSMAVLEDTPERRSIVVCGIGMEVWTLDL